MADNTFETEDRNDLVEQSEHKKEKITITREELDNVVSTATTAAVTAAMQFNNNNQQAGIMTDIEGTKQILSHITDQIIVANKNGNKQEQERLEKTRNAQKKIFNKSKAFEREYNAAYSKWINSDKMEDTWFKEQGFVLVNYQKLVADYLGNNLQKAFQGVTYSFSIDSPVWAPVHIAKEIGSYDVKRMINGKGIFPFSNNVVSSNITGTGETVTGGKNKFETDADLKKSTLEIEG